MDIISSREREKVDYSVWPCSWSWGCQRLHNLFTLLTSDSFCPFQLARLTGISFSICMGHSNLFQIQRGEHGILLCLHLFLDSLFLTTYLKNSSWQSLPAIQVRSGQLDWATTIWHFQRFSTKINNQQQATPGICCWLK